ncbi:general transcription factor 3C polypeptide 6-like [Argopecten irradians]|uniref:general transcription factor 3C polypeptide 6-like n=1 Tax=Argopecten irradians TaxID=31199 RepID=UPI0037206DD5
MAGLSGSSDVAGEWEEEESTVVVELSGILESDFISECGGDCKVLGINTDRPLLQLDRYTFSGEYADTMGTNLIFTQGDVVTHGPTKFHEMADNPTKNLEFLCKVDKKLNMSRVFVSKTASDQADKDSDRDAAISESDKEKDATNSSVDSIPMSVDTGSTPVQEKHDTTGPKSDTQSTRTKPQTDTISAGLESEIDMSKEVSSVPKIDISGAAPDLTSDTAM